MGDEQQPADGHVDRGSAVAAHDEDDRFFEAAAPATPEQALEMRQQFQRWLRDIGASADAVADLQLVVYEALANVVEHAYPDRALLASMWLTAQVDGSDVLVTVFDVGRWREHEPEPFRGRGLELMRELTTMHIATGQRGTTVQLRAPRVITGTSHNRG